MKLWGGRFAEATNELVESYTASIAFDVRLAEVDIAGSMAHVRMLSQTGIIPAADARTILVGLEDVLADVRNNRIVFQVADEDVHMNVERMLREKIGAVAGKLHTGRSRNDQVALDMHMYMRDAEQIFITEIHALQGALLEAAERYMDVLIPGYTHLQRAQPVRLSHHLLAYFWMLQRDRARMEDARRRTDSMPLGAGALAGTTFPIDRQFVADELGFAALYENSLDAVSDRDYLIEFLAAASILMMHLSRLAEELILWTSTEFQFVELADAYCTGSSMMPQKKNPDVPELVRGKTGRVYGHLVALLTVLKGLPLAYNKDLQEDKEGVFDTIDTVLPALRLFSGMIATMRVRDERLAHVFDEDFSAATDVADYLVRKGVPFRDAHAVVGQLVLTAIRQGTGLAALEFGVYHAASPAFLTDVYDVLVPENVVEARASRGGTARSAVRLQLQVARESHTLPY